MSLKIESVLEKIQSKTILPLLGLGIIALLIRIFFTPWQLPSEAADTYTYMILGLSYSRGDFSNFNVDYITWPMFLGLFFSFFKFEDIFSYLTVMRVISILVSVFTIPVIYLLSKQFIEKKYAILSTVFFAFHPALIQNSILGLTETIFIPIGLLSVYFIIQKNDRWLPIAFAFAGLSFDTRVNGIVLLFVLLLACSIKIRPKIKLLQMLGIGIGIFMIFSVPYIINSINSGDIPFVNRVSLVEENSSYGKVISHLYDPSQTLFGTQKENIEFLFSSKSEVLENPSQSDLVKVAIFKELLHFVWISIPHLAIFVPFGIIIALQNFDYKNKILFSTIIISLIVAMPQYLISAVFRNLFFIIPLFCILSSIGIQKIIENINFKNIFLVSFILGLVLISYSFLRESTDFDNELLQEKEVFGKYVSNNFKGVFMGDGYASISRNLIDISQNSLSLNTNENILLISPGYSYSSLESLMEYVKQNNVSYLVVDDEYDNHFPIFQDIFYNEKKYPDLEKIFDSNNEGYHKYHVKIFKINYNLDVEIP